MLSYYIAALILAPLSLAINADLAPKATTKAPPTAVQTTVQTAFTTRITTITITTTIIKPTASISCGYKYCDELGTSWCFYYAEPTTYDPSRGPLPGVTRTPIGTCGTKPPEPISTP